MTSTHENGTHSSGTHESAGSTARWAAHALSGLPAKVEPGAETPVPDACSKARKWPLARFITLPPGPDRRAHISLFHWLAAMAISRLPMLGDHYFRDPDTSPVSHPDFPYDAMGLDAAENRRSFARYEASLARNVQQQHCSLLNNVSTVGRHFGLDVTEECLLVLLTAARLDLKLMRLLNTLGEQSPWEWNFLLGDMLGCNPADIGEALHCDRPLQTTGLIRVCLEETRFEERFRLFPSLEMRLTSPGFRLHNLASSLLVPAGKPRVRLARFAHHKRDILAIARLLEAHIDGGIPGCHILLHGEPGAGKSELAIQLARYCHAYAQYIRPCFANGRVRDGEERLQALGQVQGIASALYNTVVVFDNMEDIMASVSHGYPGLGEHKYWFTRQMEQGRVPVIWVANDISRLDASLLQRFTYVLKVKPESEKACERIILRYAEPFPVDEAWAASVTARYRATPAAISHACEVARLCATSAEEFRNSVERCLGNLLEASGEAPAPQAYHSELAYRPEYCNAGIDLVALATALGKSKEGRICVYGPPGTGKTALAWHIGQQLRITVLHRKASDLLGKYIGETEQAIAGMFAEAKRKKALLLLDEADTFLGNRSQHGKSWETSMVNELLVQLEAFSGIFIATTNLFDNLDPAVMRRFDFKLHFDYLTEAQQLALFAEQAGCQVSWLEGQGLAAGIRRLHQLTPGDFSTVARRLRILGEQPTPQALLDSLAREVALKKGRHAPIGFIH